jgi:filamentous hemagglutinin family protein
MTRIASCRAALLSCSVLAMSKGHAPSRASTARTATLLSAAALLACAAPALAQTAPSLPNGGVFVAGEGTIQTAPNSMTITQSSNRGVIDWREFSIGAGHQVQIDNATGATLNRVMGGQLSRIEGALSATGSVYLMNPAGVIVGPGGKVMTGGDYIATTGTIDKGAFMAGGALAISGATGASIANQGSIVSQTGSVMMIARSVSNSGTITAAKGRVALTAATDVLLATTDGRADNIYVSVGADGGDITQTGRIEAAAVALKAANGNIFALAGNRDGLVQATGTATIDGELWLTAPKGNVTLEGEFAASNADGSGGRIVATGKTIDVAATADLRATGTHGGEVLVGADAYGTGTGIAERTTIASGARIAAGGPGGGGRVETSGKAFVLGNAEITAGRGGNWLIDPDDILIDATAASTIVTSLDAGTNVTQQTTSGGTGGVGDITVAAPIVWTGAGDLTLDAFRDIAINETISGGGELTLNAARNLNVNAAVSAAQVGAFIDGTLTIGAAGSVSSPGTIGLDTATFVNQAGASAITTGGNWFVASNDPANDSDGGLVPDYYAYDYDNLAGAPAPGNGRFYRVAPSVTISLGSVTKSYDGTTTAILDDSNTTVAGLIAGDDWTLDGTYAIKDVGTAINVTADNFEATRGGIPVFGYATNAPVTAATGTITAAVLTASIIGNPTKTYNATTAVALTSANFGLTGVAAGESITVNAAASAAYDSADAGSRTVDATFTSTNFAAGAGTSLSNYVLPTAASGAGLINPASLIVSGVTVNDKVYDGTRAATLSTGSASIFGVIGGDDVSLDSSGATGAFVTKNVGTNVAVIETGFVLLGADAPNYVVTQPSDLAANITPAPLVVSGLMANDKIYDGTATATLNTTGVQFTGLISGDDVTPGGSAQINFATKNAGQDIPVSITGLTLAGADAGNYDLSYSGSLAADILQRQLTVDFSATPTKVYDGTTNVVLSGSDALIGNVVAGESITIPQAADVQYASKNVGVWDITGTLTPADYQAGPNTLLSNYILPTAGTFAQGEITPAPLAISIIGNPTKQYDGNANASLGPDNFAVTGFVVGEGAAVTETSGQYSSADAGTRTVTVELDASDFDPDAGTAMSNYFIPSPVYGPGTITRIPLGPGIINVDITGNPSKVYDGTLVATLTSDDYTLSGFIAGEGATITETVGQYDLKDAGPRVVLVLLDPGDFAADPGTNLDNYTLPDQATGVGTIFAKQLTASIIGNPTKVYNGTVRAVAGPANYSVAGVVAGESVTVAPGVVANYGDADAGARLITANFTADSNFAFDSNTLRGNYILPTIAQGPGTITPAPLAVLGVSALNKVYDQTTVAALTAMPRCSAS